MPLLTHVITCSLLRFWLWGFNFHGPNTWITWLVKPMVSISFCRRTMEAASFNDLSRVTARDALETFLATPDLAGG